MTDATRDALQAEELMAHVRAICEEIGARPPTSPKERETADYVKRALREAGVETINEQAFRSHDSIGNVIIPYAVVGTIAAPLAAIIGGRTGKLIGGLGMAYGTWGLRQQLLTRQSAFHDMIAQGQSQNVIAKIAPKGAMKRRLFLVAHLDSNKQRFLSPPPKPSMMKLSLTVSVVMAGLSAVLLLLGFLTNRKRIPTLSWLASMMSLGSLAGLLYDEQQPTVQGANDNASGVAVLLGLAKALQADPLENTEVTLLFTGAEEVGGVGIQQYLEEHKPPRTDTYWIVTEMVGTGNICYVSEHGVSYVSTYRPHPEMAILAAKVSRENPDLKVYPKDMTIADEVAPLAQRGYRGLAVVGYGVDGMLPNWHRDTDTLDKIEPDTLETAARYIHALAREVDKQ